MSRSVSHNNEDDTIDDMEAAGGLPSGYGPSNSSIAHRPHTRLTGTSIGGLGGSSGVGGLRGTGRGVDGDKRPGLWASLSKRSLFVFSEENFIRKYAKLIIEWGYPFTMFFDHHQV